MYSVVKGFRQSASGTIGFSGTWGRCSRAKNEVKRGDVYWKLLFVAANGMHWFNPIVWFMQKEAAVDMELSCDERVTRGADLATKKAYTETLLSTLHKGYGRRIALSTGFYGGKQIMKKRFQNILRKTGKKNGFSILACAVALTVSMGMLVGCSVIKEHIDEMADNKESEFTKMAGSWMIDLERTDPNIWGTGISFGDEMEISESGEFSYYIGITVGGTGQCEEDNGEISVEIEPYEPHSEEKEILTLKYENDGGAEYILMDWYGETVYWKRSVQSEKEHLSENLPVEESVAEDTITLTIMKEGFIEEKQATLVVDDEAPSGFMIVDLEGEDAVYPISSDCKYFILENHQGESVELDAEAFEKYWRETEFPIFWGVTLVDGEVVDFAEWYRP